MKDPAYHFTEDDLGAALERYSRSKKPNAETAQVLKAVADFFKSDAAKMLRETEGAQA